MRVEGESAITRNNIYLNRFVCLRANKLFAHENKMCNDISISIWKQKKKKLKIKSLKKPEILFPYIICFNHKRERTKLTSADLHWSQPEMK